MRDLFTSPAKKVVHHLGMEAGWSHVYFGQGLTNVVGDTMLMARREDEDQPISLEVLAARRFPEKFAGYKLASNEALESGQAAWLDPAILGTRNALDCEATLLLYRDLEAVLGPRQMAFHREFDIPIASAVARMAGRGLKLNRKALAALQARCLVRTQGALDLARKVAEKPDLNLRSHPQVREVMEKMGAKTDRLTGKGAMATGKLPLMAMAADLDLLTPKGVFTEALLDFREADKIYSTYAVGLGKQLEGGFLYSDWRWPGTSTWRLSSSRPNLQNIPIRKELGRGVREAIVSRWDDGWLVEVDQSQIEPRILASLSGDKAMRRIFESGGDLYLGVAEKVFGQEKARDMRFCTKVVYLGWMYNAQASTTQSSVLGATGVRLPLKVVEALLRGFDEEFRGASEYMEDLRNRAMKGEVIQSPIGGYCTRPAQALAMADGWGKKMEIVRSAANFPIQCAGSILTLKALSCIPENEHAVPCAVVHDSILTDCRTKEEACRVSSLVSQRMVDVCRGEAWFSVPAAAEGKMGQDWANMKKN